MAYVIAPDGTPGSVPDAQLQEAVAQGYRVREATASEKAREEAASHPIQAGLEGVVEGASLGFATPLVRNVEATFTGKTNEQVAEEMRLRKAENPAANLVGQVAGTGAMTLATGGSGAIAKAVGGGVKGALAAGAAEGTLAGLGAVVDETTLENQPLTAEKLAMGGAGGMLLGGTMGAAFHGVGVAASAAVKKLGASSLGQKLNSVASDLEWDALSKGLSARKAQKAEKYKDEILAAAKGAGITGSGGAVNDAAIAAAEAAKKKAGQVIGDQIARLEQVVPLVNNDVRRAAIVSNTEGILDAQFGQNPAYASAVAKAKKDLGEVLADPKTSWKSLWDWQTRIFNETPKGDMTPAAVKEVMGEVRDSIRYEAMLAAETANPGQMAAMKKAASSYAAHTSLADMIERTAAKVERMPGVLEGMAEGAMMGGAFGNIVAGAAAGGARNFVKKLAASRGGLFAASALREVASGNLIPGTAANLMKRVATGATDMVAPGIRTQLEQAAALGADDLLAEHTRIANGPQGDQYLASLGMSHESPEEMAATSQRLGAYHAIQQHAALVDGAMEGAVGGLLGAKPGRAPAVNMGVRTDYLKTKEKLEALLNDPSKGFESVPPEYLNTAPNITGLTLQTLQRGAKYLLDNAPKNPHAGLPSVLQPKWEPSRADMDRWQRSIEAVENPLKVLEQMGQGVLTQEHVKALQAVYPLAYEDLKSRIFERLSTWEKPIPYQRKLALAQVFGPKALGSSIEQQKMIQLSQEGAVKQAQPGSMKGPDGRQQIDAQKNAETQGQRMEQR